MLPLMEFKEKVPTMRMTMPTAGYRSVVGRFEYLDYHGSSYVLVKYYSIPVVLGS